MKNYKVIESLSGKNIIQYEENNILFTIPEDPANSDYQAYLRHLAGEEETGTLS